jgi:WD40 repeat protein
MDFIAFAAFSSDGSKILTRSPYIAQLLDASTGSIIMTFSRNSGSVTSAALSPDGSKVLTGCNDATAILWDAGTGSVIRIFSGHKYSVSSVAFSPDGSKVLTGSDDATAMLWDASTGSNIRTFSGHSSTIYSVAFSPDGSKVLTGSNDATAMLWDISDIALTAAKTRKNFKMQPCYSLVFLPNYQLVLFNSSTIPVFSPGIVICNAIGRTVASFKSAMPIVSERQEFALPKNLAKGVYFYRLDYNDDVLKTGVFMILR